MTRLSGAAVPRQLFIYYRIAPADLAAVCAAWMSVQQALCATHPGLQARMHRRPETSSDGMCTLMETYCFAHHAQGVSESLQAEIDAAAGAALRPWLRGARHCEVFVEIPCAS